MADDPQHQSTRLDIRRTWRLWRLEIALFRSTTGAWTRNGERKALGLYAPIPGAPIPGGTRSAALVVGVWLLGFFWESRHAA